MPVKCHISINGQRGENKKEALGKMQEKPQLLEDLGKQMK